VCSGNLARARASYESATTGRALDDPRLLPLSRWLTAAWGIALIGIALLARGWGPVFATGLTIASLVYGPMLGTFLLALLTRRANQAGALTGVAVSLAAMILIRTTTPLAWTWYVVTGAGVAFAVGYLVSVLTKRHAAA